MLKSQLLTTNVSDKPRWVWLLLAGLVSGALFPYGWLADISPTFERGLAWVFRSDAAHVVGHLFVFGLLATAVLVLFPGLKKRPFPFYALILTLGLAQEALQLISFKHHFFSSGELFDLVVDLCSATAVFLFFRKQ
ncbi:MAG: hypothetical protein R3C62_12850 [Chloroflexota bacterium]